MAISVMALTPCVFFSTASAPALQFAASHMNLLHMRRREVLHRTSGGTGQTFDGLGVVLQGGLQAIDLTLDGKEVGVMNVGPHEPFGHTLLLAERPIELTWVASSGATTAAIMERDKALQLLGFPEMMAMVARLNGQQVSDLIGWQKVQAIHPVSARVCAWLLRQSIKDRVLRLPTHAEMAWRLNTTRESVTRVLQKLLTEGVLRRDGDDWHLVRINTLEEMARGEDR